MSLGLLALSRSGVRELRALCLGSAIVIVLLMWGECLRQVLDGGLGVLAAARARLVVVGQRHADAARRLSAGVASPARRGCVVRPAARAIAVTAPEAAGQRRERGPRPGRGPRYC